MVENGLEISIQKEQVAFRDLTQPLKLRNYFLIHDCGPEDMDHVFYTEQDLRKIH